MVESKRLKIKREEKNKLSERGVHPATKEVLLLTKNNERIGTGCSQKKLSNFWSPLVLCVMREKTSKF